MNNQSRPQPVPRLPDGTLDINCTCSVPIVPMNTSLHYCTYDGECRRVLNIYCWYEFKKERKVYYP